MRTAGLNSDSDLEGQTTKESHTLKSKVHALPVDNPLNRHSPQAVDEQDFAPVVSSQPSAVDEKDPIDTVISYCRAKNIQIAGL